MMQINDLIRYEGGCHCGAVRFQVRANPTPDQVSDCNCSICRKKGFLHLIVPLEQFTWLRGEDALTTYTFNTGIAKIKFQIAIALFAEKKGFSI